MFQLQIDKHEKKKKSVNEKGSCQFAEGIILFKQRHRGRMESAARHRTSYKSPSFSSRSTHQAHLAIISSLPKLYSVLLCTGVQPAGAESTCEPPSSSYDFTMEWSVAAARDGQAPRQLPPGFRFHPTDEELVVQYLRRKVLSRPLPAAVIPVVHDVATLDPWDLPGAGEGEAYFFSLRRGAPATDGGGRRRRARSGYWKATGKAKPVFLQGSGCGGKRFLVGVKTALAFHRGEPSSRTAWVMHEYRLAVPAEQRKDATHQGRAVPPGPGEWVVCRVFLKNSSTRRPNRDAAGETPGNLASSAASLGDQGTGGRLRLLLSSSPQASSSSCVTGVTEISDQDEVSSGQRQQRPVGDATSVASQREA